MSNPIISIAAKAPSLASGFERRPHPDAAQLQARTPVRRIIPNDFYPTPPEAVRALLSVESFDGPIWEPACGDGAISKVLTRAGYDVVSSDLYDYGFGGAGVDFLRERPARGRHVVTNPPYGKGLADAFTLHGLQLIRATGGKLVFLLNLSSLCHPRRTAFWKRNVPARIYAIDGVLCWPTERHGPPPFTSQHERYCWVVWSPEHQGAPTFGWLSASDFR